MRGRKRRTKYTWLPPDPTELILGEDEFDATPFDQVVTYVPNDPQGHVNIVAVLSDVDATDDETATTTLADSIGSEYFIKRIVGKCFVEHRAIRNGESIAYGIGTQLPSSIVKCGLFVAPADPGKSQPMGAVGTDIRRFNPLNSQSSREPWIWQRSWILTAGGGENGGQTEVTAPGGATGQLTGQRDTPPFSTTGLSSWPNTNARYGSVMDGPHVDAKTARRVRQHERLWAAISAAPYPLDSGLDGTAFQQAEILVHWDLRVLGALRKARNRSSFE